MDARRFAALRPPLAATAPHGAAHAQDGTRAHDQHVKSRWRWTRKTSRRELRKELVRLGSGHLLRRLEELLSDGAHARERQVAVAAAADLVGHAELVEQLGPHFLHCLDYLDALHAESTHAKPVRTPGQQSDSIMAHTHARART